MGLPTDQPPAASIAATTDVCIGQAHDGPVEDFLDVARVAAGMGYRRIWIGETYKVDAMVFMAGLVRELPGQRLGVGPMPLPLRTAAQLTMAAATLRGLGHPEPIEFLLGASSPAMTEGWNGRPMTTLAATEALFAGVRQAAGGSRTEIEHPHARSHGFVNGLGPVDLRLGLAAAGPRMLRLAGRIADRVAFNMVSVQQAAEMAEVVAAGAEEAGRPCPPITVWVHCCCDPDEETVARGKRFLSGYVRAPGYRDVIAGQGFESVIAAAAQAGNARAIRELIPTEMLQQVLGYGTASEIQQRVRSFRALGLETAVVPSITHDRGGRACLAAIAALDTALDAAPAGEVAR
ncbi:MAG: LLM class flavin-dependent oxidoreductase [Acidimicrobiia bacterium]